MRKIAAVALLVVAGALVASCGGEKKRADGAADAGGQILSRSVTDEMLPYDTVRSKPPLAEPDASEAAFDTRPGAAALPAAIATGTGDGTGADSASDDEDMPVVETAGRAVRPGAE